MSDIPAQGGQKKLARRNLLEASTACSYCHGMCLTQLWKTVMIVLMKNDCVVDKLSPLVLHVQWRKQAVWIIWTLAAWMHVADFTWRLVVVALASAP